MMRVAKWGLGVLVLFLLATAVKHYLLNLKIRKPGDPPYSPAARTPAKAKERGLWVCDVAAEPETLQKGKVRVRFKEAWVERAIDEVEYFLVWFPYAKHNDWSFLCVRVAEWEDGMVRLVTEPTNSTFSISGTEGGDYLCWMKLQPGDPLPTKVSVEFSDWTTHERDTIGVVTLTPVPQ
jgi:hypothetical protein